MTNTPIPNEPDEYELGAEILATEPTEWEIVEYETPPAEDAHMANVLVRRLARVRSSQAEVKARYGYLLAELNAWRDDTNAGLTKQETYLESTLGSWLKAVGKTSVKLPHGKVWSRKGSTRLEINDEAGFVKWAVKNERTDLLAFADPAPAPKAALKAFAADLPKTFGTKDKEELSPAVTSDGEVMPGLMFETDGKTYGVTT